MQPRCQNAAVIAIAILFVIGFCSEVWRASNIPHPPINQSTSDQHKHAANNEAPKESPEEAIARYNWWLTIFTAVLATATIVLGLATVGLYFAGERQLEHARSEAGRARFNRIREEAQLNEQINIARDSANAAQRAADAMSVVERAYVYPVIVWHGAIGDCIENARVFYIDDLTKDDVPAAETAEITFKFKNFGKTPALLKTAFAGLGVAPLGTQIGLPIVESVLGVGEETVTPFISEMQVGITRKQAQHILAYTGHVCFEGHVTFDDIWGNEHTTEFYFVWDKEIKRMALRGVETKTKQKNG